MKIQHNVQLRPLIINLAITRIAFVASEVRFYSRKKNRQKCFFFCLKVHFARLFLQSRPYPAAFSAFQRCPVFLPKTLPADALVLTTIDAFTSTNGRSESWSSVLNTVLRLQRRKYRSVYGTNRVNRSSSALSSK